VAILNWVTTIVSLLKACWILRSVSAWVSPSSWQNLMQYHCSNRSVILSQMRMQRTHVTPLRHPAATDASGGVLRHKKSSMRIKVPSTTTLSFSTLSPLLTAKKNTVRYFLDRPCIINTTLVYCIYWQTV
jgi:hypothetical protein